MMAALQKLNAPDLLERFLRDVVTPSYDGSENEALLASADVLAGAQTAAVLSNLVSAQMRKRPHECSELLLALSKSTSLCFPEVAEAEVAGLDSIGARDAETESPDSEAEDINWEAEDRQRPLGPEFLENLLRALPRFGDGSLCGAAAEKIASRPGVFSPVTLVVPAVERICAGRGKVTLPVESSVQRLWTGAAKFLLLRSEVPPEPPSDWNMDVEISCSCADCLELQAFARDPAAQVHRFRVKKERRRHLARNHKPIPPGYDARDRARGFAANAGLHKRPSNLRAAHDAIPGGDRRHAQARETGAQRRRRRPCRKDGGCGEARRRH
jgi:hypothetical protein